MYKLNAIFIVLQICTSHTNPQKVYVDTVLNLNFIFFG